MSRRRRRRTNVDNAGASSKTTSAPSAPTAVVGYPLFRSWTIRLLLCIPCVLFFYYAWSSRQAHQDDVTSSDVPFKVVDLPGKGKGAIATRDIQQGERVILENPLFVVPSQISSSPTVMLTNLLDSLGQAERDSFFNLSSNLPEGNTVPDDIGHLALAIFETNAVAAGDSVGIFPRMARLNHGCSRAFNVVYSWREQEGAIVVHALRPVKKGSELLTTYTNTRRTRAERRKYLQTYYHFHCACQVCSLPDSESRQSDDRLTAMSELYEQLGSWAHGGITGKQALHLVNQIWAIGEEERYWSERGQLAADAALVAAAHSDASAACEWAALAAKWFGYELGSDSIQAHDMAEMMQDPRSHPAWSSRENT